VEFLMPMMLTLVCDKCGGQWRHLQMTKSEALPDCPRCAKAVVVGLSAPAIGRDAQPVTQWEVPDTRAKREDLAYKIAEEQGATNIRTGQRMGDIAAMPVPEAEVVAPNGRRQRVANQFVNAGSAPQDIAASISSLTGGMGAAAHPKNLGIMGKITGR
jgi:predicted nucleic acid-binding Zn ribbon protein